ncbi:hypothetical protein ACRW9N_10760 [Listeria aquatica]|uniref:hypothetical protein n=1 Tax=Listeria aquatica TaxID=1494960 RepID=UPI003EF9BAD4
MEGKRACFRKWGALCLVLIGLSYGWLFFLDGKIDDILETQGMMKKKIKDVNETKKAKIPKDSQQGTYIYYYPLNQVKKLEQLQVKEKFMDEQKTVGQQKMKLIQAKILVGKKDVTDQGVLTTVFSGKTISVSWQADEPKKFIGTSNLHSKITILYTDQ